MATRGARPCRKAGATDDELEPARRLQRRAQWRLDYIAAENSMGFHAPQEAARLLGEAIDFARQGQVAALRLGGADAAAEEPGEGERSAEEAGTVPDAQPSARASAASGGDPPTPSPSANGR